MVVANLATEEGILRAFKEIIKKRGVEFPKGGKGKGGKGKGNPSQRNAREDDREKGICFNFSRGNGYCKYGDACRFKHEGPKGGGGGGGKRKGHPTLLAAKASPAKKLKTKAEKSGKSIASMVMKDLKAMFKEEKEDVIDEKGDLTHVFESGIEPMGKEMQVALEEG